MSKPVILCVDDEKIVLDSLRSQLRKAFNEYELEIAESGEEALEIVEELLEDEVEMPLVISDQIMPGLKGDELLTKIAQLLPKTLSILLTGQASAEAVGNAINKARLFRYISKPWEVQDLEITVKEAIKSFYQDKSLQEKNQELQEMNEFLEVKVQERTQELEMQRKLVEKKNQDIISSINYAQRIQEAMLPALGQMNKFIDDYFIFFKPRDIVSGDFYWFAEHQGKFIVTAVDCTGHGVPGAIMSMVGMEELNKIVLLYNEVSPEIILEILHKEVRTLLKQEQAQNNDGMDMAVCTIDIENQVLEYSGAKNPLIYIQENDEGKMEIHQIKGDKVSIGGFQKEDQRTFTNHKISFKKPTYFYIFSDGYQDQFGGKKDKKFMIKRMRELIFDIHTKPMDEQEKILEQTLTDWMNVGSTEQLDDVLVIGFKIGG